MPTNPNGHDFDPGPRPDAAPAGALPQPDSPQPGLARHDATCTGHGHVFPRADGVRARCGGPALCAVCARDAARKQRGDTR